MVDREQLQKNMGAVKDKEIYSIILLFASMVTYLFIDRKDRARSDLSNLKDKLTGYGTKNHGLPVQNPQKEYPIPDQMIFWQSISRVYEIINEIDQPEQYQKVFLLIHKIEENIPS